MDVKNAFLNGDLQEEVYMQPPRGYPHSGSQVCRLRRAFYGLKQAPRAWFEKFSSVVAQYPFSSALPQYYLFQAKYASDLLSKAGITDNKTVSTPLEYNAKLAPLDGEPISDATRYHQLVGSLIYLTVTRLDISHAVGMVSKFMDAPHFVHYVAVLWILRYIKGTLYHDLHYSSRSSLKLHAYSDADWAGDSTDRCSITGFCFLLGTSLVSWHSKKQDVVFRSNIEVEYRALANTTCELV
ncbi:secreted RxLR effector protein 161-like [Castanea sativa]|uniref:secreted RxLR effector protein 161-like n=1 Tax=Castanea sativa TaxID=21020 RepID=UPI003F64EC98